MEGWKLMDPPPFLAAKNLKTSINHDVIYPTKLITYIDGLKKNKAMQLPFFLKQVWNRITQIFILECVLDVYRKSRGTVFEPLENEKALRHMIFQSTKWKLSEIDKLTFAERLFIISDKINMESLPDDAGEFLSSVDLPEKIAYPLDDFSEEDWAPRENSVFLKNHS